MFPKGNIVASSGGIEGGSVDYAISISGREVTRFCICLIMN